MAGAKKQNLEPGTVVGRYRIDGIVGKGGFGAVYRATHLDSNAPVALKILLKNFSSAKTDWKRFKREAALVQKLRHPKIVQLYDYGYTDRQQPFIAFELLDGESLGEVLKARGPFPLFRVASIAIDVLEALEAAHAYGVIHRDIKPGNVFLLQGGGGAKVLDFGIAKAVSGEEAAATQLTEAGQMIGTPHYMAPEQVRGTGVVPATDLYALGLVMAEMITGQRAVTGHALLDIYMEHIQESSIAFAEAVRISPLWPVIEGATQKALDRRYPSASAMLAELRPIAMRLSGEVAINVTMPHPVRDALNQTYRIPEPPGDAAFSAVASASPLSSGTVLMTHPLSEPAPSLGGGDPLGATMDMSDAELRSYLAAAIAPPATERVGPASPAGASAAPLVPPAPRAAVRPRSRSWTLLIVGLAIIVAIALALVMAGPWRPPG